MKTEKEIVEAYLEASNRQDVDAMMSCYAEDATFEVVDYFTHKGKQALRHQEEYYAAINTQVKFYDYVVEPGQISFKVIEQSELLRTFGVDKLRFPSCTMTISNGLITSVRTEFSQESREQAEQAGAAFMTWVAKEKPEAFAKMMSGGEFIPCKESGLIVMALLQELKAVQK